MSNPFARLAGSLANALLDLGLPAIRGWLRERLGPDADVANVTTDGSIVRLEGVRVPIGPRVLVVLERAAATITSLGDDGPALRLHSFEGVLVSTSGASPPTPPPHTRPREDAGGSAAAGADPVRGPAAFRAEIRFAASEDPDPAAWIWGDVAITNAVWAAKGDSAAAPLHGAARLFVSSHDWRVEGGRLDGGPSSGADEKPPVVARFAAAGAFEVTPLATLVLTLEHARVGPFIDAVTALAGGSVKIPAAIPRDTRLDGELLWTVEAGARADLRLDAATIGARATMRGSCAPDGSALDADVKGTAALAALARRAGAPAAATPREEDVVGVIAKVRGTVRAPEARIDLESAGLGFRLGRPRYVPAVVVHGVSGHVVVKDGVATGRVTAKARASDVAVDVTAARDAVRVAITADSVEAAFLRDLAATLGAKVTVPDDLSAGIALAYEGAWNGTVALATARSRLLAQLGGEPAQGVARITGGLKVEDVLATGLFAGASVYPSQGDLVVVFDVLHDDAGAIRARGSLAAAGKLALAIRARPDVGPYVVEGAHADVTIDARGITYEGLRFTGYEGRFAGYGTILFGSAAPPAASALPPVLVLQLVDAGSPLAQALFQLVPSPRPAIGFPSDLGWRGDLTLAADFALGIDAVLVTPAGTDLAVGLRLRRSELAGSTAKGSLAVVDALGILAQPLPIAPEGVLGVDADVASGFVLRVAASAARLVVPPLTLEGVSASLVVADGDILWNRAEAVLAGGRLSSLGVARRSGEVDARVSAASVAVHELPAIAGRVPSAYVRGRASGTALAHRGTDRVIEARGDVVLDEASFPLIDRARPQLDRYGLRPPNEDAAGPAVATISVDARGVHVTDVAVALHGASMRGDVDLRPTNAIDGKVEVVLDEEYLRTSKLLTLPRVLGERLVIPIRVGGTLAKPEVHAELGHTLGNFLRDSKVGDFVVAAVEEAQHLFRKSQAPPAARALASSPPSAPSRDWETALRAAIDTRATDWDAIALRRTR